MAALEDLDGEAGGGTPTPKKAPGKFTVYCCGQATTEAIAVEADIRPKAAKRKAAPKNGDDNDAPETPVKKRGML